MSIEIILDTEVLDRLIRNAAIKADDVIGKIAHDCEAEAKRSMEGSKTGKIYRRGGIVHQASDEGEAPAVDTGHLKNSITTHKRGNADYEVWVGAEYGHWLEYGTSRMRPRPFLTPAAKKAASALPGLIKEVIEP